MVGLRLDPPGSSDSARGQNQSCGCHKNEKEQVTTSNRSGVDNRAEELAKDFAFNADDDCVWASLFVAGEMPYYLNAVQRDYIIPAGKRAGLGMIGWHTLRHTHRSFMDNNGTPLGIQKDLVRQTDIKMIMNGYGSSMPEAMREANSAVVRMGIQ